MATRASSMYSTSLSTGTRTVCSDIAKLLRGILDWKYLAWVEDIQRIEGTFDLPLDIDRERPQSAFSRYGRFSTPTPCSPDSVPPTASEAAKISADHLLNFGPLLGLALIKEDVWVQVAIAGVTKNHNRQFIFSADRPQPLDDSREWHCGVQ